MNHIKGIDSIRFICALVVLIAHVGLPTPDSSFMKSALGVLFNGPAAVIVFFIISGFCIHYPNTKKLSFTISSFYIKRFIRIVIPAIVAFTYWKAVGLEVRPPNYGVFWSIICELIYYLIYPILFVLNKRSGWLKQIIVAYLIAGLLAFYNLEVLNQNQNYTSLGLLTWIVGLPCWLLGCWLAENYKRFQAISLTKLWLVRAGISILASLFLIIRFHTIPPFSSYIFSLNIFALFACMWLGLEIVYFELRKPVKLLEWGGKWSYSLYIIHPAAGAALSLIGLPILSENLEISIMLSLSLFFSYIFYLVIELPSHRLAVIISKFFYKEKGELAT